MCNITRDAAKMQMLWAVVSLLISIILFLTGVSFSEPDDYLLSGIYSGCYGDGLNSVLVPYVNAVYGCIARIVRLFTEQPVAWGIILLVLLACASFNIHLAFSAKRFNIVGHISVIITQVSLGKLFLTYTVVAYLLCGSALFLVFLGLDNHDKSSGFAQVLAAIGLVLGILLRREVLLSVLLITLPLFRGMKEKRKTLIIVVVTTVLFVAADYSLYSFNDGWDGYYHWNSERTEFVDYDIQWKEIGIDETLAEIDWDYNDIEMITHWRFADQNVFSAGNMDAMTSYVPLGEKYDLNIHSLISSLAKNRLTYAIAAIGLLCAVFEKNKRNKLVILYSAAAMILMILGLYIRQRFVARVYVPLFILSFFQILLHIDVQENRENLMIGSVCALIALIAFRPLYQQRTAELQATPSVSLRSYLEKNSDKTFISESSIVNLLWNNKPIQELERRDYPVNILKTGSWDSFSGRYYYLTKKNRIDSDSLFCDLTHGEGIFYITYSETDAESVGEFIKKHYPWSGSFELADSLEGFLIYKYS